VRSIVASLEIVVLSSHAHYLAGGALPSTAYLLAILGLVGAGSALLRHRLLSTRVAIGAVVAGQLLVHTASTTTTTMTHGPHAAGLSPSADMLLAHAFSAAVTLAALLWQEQAVVRLVRVLFPPARCGSFSRPTLSLPARHPGGVRRGIEVVRHTPRRGPPSLVAAAAT
jgi:hypothetical protein